MNIPKLKKEKTVKTYHGYELIDDYAWIDQDNILEVLQDPKKLLPDVRKYLEENNKLTEDYFDDVKDLQKKLFSEIKSKIKLEDESLKYKDDRYFYWTKTVKEGNPASNLRFPNKNTNNIVVENIYNLYKVYRMLNEHPVVITSYPRSQRYISFKMNDNGTLNKMTLKKGDKVLYGKYSGSEVSVEGEDLMIMRESDILATL